MVQPNAASAAADLRSMALALKGHITATVRGDSHVSARRQLSAPCRCTATAVDLAIAMISAWPCHTSYEPHPELIQPHAEWCRLEAEGCALRCVAPRDTGRASQGAVALLDTIRTSQSSSPVRSMALACSIKWYQSAPQKIVVVAAGLTAAASKPGRFSLLLQRACVTCKASCATGIQELSLVLDWAAAAGPCSSDRLNMQGLSR